MKELFNRIVTNPELKEKLYNIFVHQDMDSLQAFLHELDAAADAKQFMEFVKELKASIELSDDLLANVTGGTGTENESDTYTPPPGVEYQDLLRPIII